MKFQTSLALSLSLILIFLWASIPQVYALDPESGKENGPCISGTENWFGGTYYTNLSNIASTACVSNPPDPLVGTQTNGLCGDVKEYRPGEYTITNTNHLTCYYIKPTPTPTITPTPGPAPTNIGHVGERCILASTTKTPTGDPFSRTYEGVTDVASSQCATSQPSGYVLFPIAPLSQTQFLCGNITGINTGRGVIVGYTISPLSTNPSCYIAQSALTPTPTPINAPVSFDPDAGKIGHPARDAKQIISQYLATNPFSELSGGDDCGWSNIPSCFLSSASYLFIEGPTQLVKAGYSKLDPKSTQCDSGGQVPVDPDTGADMQVPGDTVPARCMPTNPTMAAAVKAAIDLQTEQVAAKVVGGVVAVGETDLTEVPVGDVIQAICDGAFGVYENKRTLAELCINQVPQGKNFQRTISSLSSFVANTLEKLMYPVNYSWAHSVIVTDSIGARITPDLTDRICAPEYLRECLLDKKNYQSILDHDLAADAQVIRDAEISDWNIRGYEIRQGVTAGLGHYDMADANLSALRSCFRCAGRGQLYTALGCMPTDDLGKFVTETVFGIVFAIAGAFCLGCIIYATMKIQTSGVVDQIEDARKLITNCVGGLALIIFSIFVLRFIGVDLLRIPGLQ